MRGTTDFGDRRAGRRPWNAGQSGVAELRTGWEHAAGQETGIWTAGQRRRRRSWENAAGAEAGLGTTGQSSAGEVFGMRSLEYGSGGPADEWGSIDVSEGFDLEVYPKEEIYEERPPEELLEANPRPAPILLALLIVIWLCLPFIASVIFLVIIIGLLATTDGPYQHLSLRSSFSGLTAVGESLGLKSLYPYIGRNSGLWDANIVTKLWNQLLDSSPALQSIQQDGRAVAATQVDWVETADAHVFKVDMPGLRKEDVRVELEGDSILQISGQRASDFGGRPETLHRLERSQGRFLRRFQLPPNTQIEDVQAKVENGVLTVMVPKREKYPLVVKRTVAIS